jgi:hypothetical protein
MSKLKIMPLKTIPADQYFPELGEYANFSASGSIKGMKDKYYGKYALLVKCGKYIYNVSSNPHIYHNIAK